MATTEVESAEVVPLTTMQKMEVEDKELLTAEYDQSADKLSKDELKTIEIELTKALETAEQSGDGDTETLQVQHEAEVRNLDGVSEGGIFVITPSVPEVAEERRTFTESHVDTVNAEKNELSVKGKVEELKESRIVDEETEEIEEKKEAVPCPDDVDIRKSEGSVPVNQTDEDALVDNKGEREKTLDSKAEDISITENKAEVPQEPESAPIAPYTEEILEDSDGSEDLQGIKGKNIVEYPSASKEENDDTEREKPVKDSIDHDVLDKVQEPENNANIQAEELATGSIRVEEQIIESIWKGEDESEQANSLNNEPQVERLQIHSDIIPGKVEDAVPSDIADKTIQEVEEENTINEQHTKEGDAILNELTSTNTMDTAQSNLKETDDVEVENLIKQGLKEAGEDTLSAESEKIDEIPTDTHERPADDGSVPKKEEEADKVLPTGITEKETGEPVQEAETSNLQSAELEKTEKADTKHTNIVKDEEIEEADIVQVDDKPRDVAGAHITAEPSEVDILPAESFTGEVNEQTYEEKNEEEPSPTSNIEQLLQEQENKSEKREAINEEVKDELASTSTEDSVNERTIIGGHLLTESHEDVTTVSLDDEKVDSNKNETSEQFITELSQIEEGPEKCNSQDDKAEVMVPESSVNPTSENPEEVVASDDGIRINTNEQEADKVEEQGTATKVLMDKETDKTYDAQVTEEPRDVKEAHFKEGSREVDIPPVESLISEVNDEEPSPTSNAESLPQEEETTSEIREAINEEEEVNDEQLSDSTYDNVKKDSNIVGQEKDILSESHEEDVTDVSLDDKNEDSNRKEISDQVITEITAIKEDSEIHTLQNEKPELETPESSSNSSPDKPEEVTSHHVDGLTATTNEELEGKIEEQSSNITEYKRASDTESAREAETIENSGVAESETLDKEAEVQEILSTDEILTETHEEVTDDADNMELLEKSEDEAPAELTVTKDSSELLLPQEIKKSETSQDEEDEEKPAHADETPDIVEQALIVTPAELKEDEPEKCEDISVSVEEPVEIVKHIVEPDKEDHTSELKMQSVAEELPVASPGDASIDVSDAAENVVTESVEGKITYKSDDELVVDDIIVSESQTQSQKQEEVSAQDVETSMEVASGSNPGDSANLKVSEHDPAQIDKAPEILEHVPVVTPAEIKEDASEKDEDKSVCLSVEEPVEKVEHIVETEKENTTCEREIEGVAEQLMVVSQGGTIVSVSDTAEVVTENVEGKSIEETVEESAVENATKLDELVVLEPGIQTYDAEEVPTVVEEVDETPSPNQRKNKVETSLEVVSEPDPDESENLKQLSEPDPDDSEILENVSKQDTDGNEKLTQVSEPDPDDSENLKHISEPDPDDSENIEKVSQPDPVDTVILERFSEREPDESDHLIKDSESDPGDFENLKNVSEADPHDSEKLKKVSEPVLHDTNILEKFAEPDPDDYENQAKVNETEIPEECVEPTNKELPITTIVEVPKKTEEQSIEAAVSDEVSTASVVAQTVSRNIEVIPATDAAPELSVNDSGNEESPIQELRTEEESEHTKIAGQTTEGQETVSGSIEVIPATDAAPELSVKDSVNEESQIQELRTVEESEHTEIVGQTSQEQETVGHSIEVIPTTDAAPEKSVIDSVNEESQIREIRTEEESADTDIVDNQATQAQESDIDHVEESGSSEKVSTDQQDGTEVEIQTSEVSEELITKVTEGDEEPSPPTDASARDSELDNNQGEEIEQLTSKSVDTEMAATTSVNDENINVLKSEEDKQKDDATDENIEAATDVREQEDEQELKINEPNETKDTELFNSSVSDEVGKKNDRPKEIENVEEKLTADEVAEQEDDELQQKDNEPPASDLNDEDTTVLKKSPEEVQEELSVENQPKDYDNVAESKILKEAIVQEDEQGDDDTNFQEKFSEPDPDDSESQNLKKVSESAPEDSENQAKTDKTEIPEECVEPTNKELPIATNVEVPEKTDEQTIEAAVSDEVSTASEVAQTVSRSIEVIPATDAALELSVNYSGNVESPIQELRTEEESENTEIAGQTTQGQETFSRSFDVIPATDAAPDLSVKHSGNEESPIQELRTEEESEHTEIAGQTTHGQETVSRSTEVIPATDAAPDLSVKDSVNEESQIQELRTEEESEHTEIVGQTTQEQETVSHSIEVIPATDAAPELSVKDSVNGESQIRELGTKEESEDTDIAEHTEIADHTTQVQESDIEHVEEPGSSEKVSTVQHDGAEVEIQTSEVSEELITKEIEGDEEPSPPTDASARDSELDHNQGEELEQLTSISEDTGMAATSSVNEGNINVLKSEEDKQKDDATDKNIEAATGVLEPEEEQELKIKEPNETEDTEKFTSSVSDEIGKENDQPKKVENVEEKLTADEVAEQENDELQQEANEPSTSDLNDEDTTILKKNPEEVQVELSVENQPKDDDSVTESEILKEAIVQEDEQGDDYTNFQEKFSEPDPDDSENLKKVSESATDDSANQDKVEKPEAPEECHELTNKEFPVVTNVDVTELNRSLPLIVTNADEQPKETEVSDEANASSVEEETISRSIEVITPTNTVSGLNVEEDSSSQITELITEKESELTEIVNSQATQEPDSDIKQVEESYSHEAVNINELDHVNVEILTGELSEEGGEGLSPQTDASVEDTVSGESDKNNAKKEEELENVAGNLNEEDNEEILEKQHKDDASANNKEAATKVHEPEDAEEQTENVPNKTDDTKLLTSRANDEDKQEEKDQLIKDENAEEKLTPDEIDVQEEDVSQPDQIPNESKDNELSASNLIDEDTTILEREKGREELLEELSVENQPKDDDSVMESEISKEALVQQDERGEEGVHMPSEAEDTEIPASSINSDNFTALKTEEVQEEEKEKYQPKENETFNEIETSTEVIVQEDKQEAQLKHLQSEDQEADPSAPGVNIDEIDIPENDIDPEKILEVDQAKDEDGKEIETTKEVLGQESEGVEVKHLPTESGEAQPSGEDERTTVLKSEDEPEEILHEERKIDIVKDGTEEKENEKETLGQISDETGNLESSVSYASDKKQASLTNDEVYGEQEALEEESKNNQTEVHENEQKEIVHEELVLEDVQGEDAKDEPFASVGNDDGIITLKSEESQEDVQKTGAEDDGETKLPENANEALIEGIPVEKKEIDLPNKIVEPEPNASADTLVIVREEVETDGAVKNQVTDDKMNTNELSVEEEKKDDELEHLEKETEGIDVEGSKQRSEEIGVVINEKDPSNEEAESQESKKNLEFKEPGRVEDSEKNEDSATEGGKYPGDLEDKVETSIQEDEQTKTVDEEVAPTDDTEIIKELVETSSVTDTNGNVTVSGAIPAAEEKSSDQDREGLTETNDANRLENLASVEVLNSEVQNDWVETARVSEGETLESIIPVAGEEDKSNFIKMETQGEKLQGSEGNDANQNASEFLTTNSDEKSLQTMETVKVPTPAEDDQEDVSLKETVDEVPQESLVLQEENTLGDDEQKELTESEIVNDELKEQKGQDKYTENITLACKTEEQHDGSSSDMVFEAVKLEEPEANNALVRDGTNEEVTHIELDNEETKGESETKIETPSDISEKVEVKEARCQETPIVSPADDKQEIDQFIKTEVLDENAAEKKVSSESSQVSTREVYAGEVKQVNEEKPDELTKEVPDPEDKPEEIKETEATKYEGVIKDDGIKDLKTTDIKGYKLEEHSMDEANKSKTTDAAIEVNLTDREALQVAETTSEHVEISSIPKDTPNTNVLKTGESEDATEESKPVECKSIEGCIDEITRKDSNVLVEMKDDTKPSSETEILSTIRGIKDEDLEYQQQVKPQNKISNVQGKGNDNNLAIPLIEQTTNEVVLVKDTHAEQISKDDLLPVSSEIQQTTARSLDCAGVVQSESAKITETPIPSMIPAENSLSDLLQISTKDTIQMNQQPIQETNPETKKGNTQPEDPKTDEDKDEEYDEGDEHKKTDSSSDGVIVEASRDMDVKSPQKKHHGILSGVGTKVKNSISKVKKAITGKSSHPKPPSPK